MKTDEEILKLLDRASNGDRLAVDEIHQLTFDERYRMFELIKQGIKK